MFRKGCRSTQRFFSIVMTLLLVLNIVMLSNLQVAMAEETGQTLTTEQTDTSV